MQSIRISIDEMLDQKMIEAIGADHEDLGVCVTRICAQLRRYAEAKDMIARFGEDYVPPTVEERKAEVAELARLREALHDIHVTAHCISKAGPLTTPTLQDAWGKFDRIAVKATGALTRRPDSPAPTCPICGESFAMVWHENIKKWVCHRTHDAQPKTL